MRRHLTVLHTTEYQYSEAVGFGRHRMMFRPRDSHTLRLLSTSLTITPKPVNIRWMYDVFGNSVSYAEFGDLRATSLRFVSEISILHYEVNQPTALLMPSAEQYPFSYIADEVPDIQPLMILNRPDSKGQLARWSEDIADRSGGQTLAILSNMMETIRGEFQYLRRPKPGTQDPVQTLELRTGSCRDFALLMIEALRSLGFAARFVSGYIYSPSRANHQGGGATHAWVQVYLPGCGWLEIDPTNGIFGNRDLIRIAVSRDHKQAAPLTGSFVGPLAPRHVGFGFRHRQSFRFVRRLERRPTQALKSIGAGSLRNPNIAQITVDVVTFVRQLLATNSSGFACKRRLLRPTSNGVAGYAH